MINLILKEFRLYKSKLLFNFCFCIVFSAVIFFVFAKSYVNLCGFILMFFPFEFIMNEFRKNGCTLLCSLPVKRTQIVLSKYISVFIFMLVLTLFLVLIPVLLLKITPDVEKKVVELKSGYKSIISGYILIVLFISSISVLSFKSGTSKNLMSLYFKSWLFLMVPAAVVLYIILLLFFNDVDWNLLINDIGIFPVTVITLFLIAFVMFFVAWFSVKFFEQRDI